MNKIFFFNLGFIITIKENNRMGFVEYIPPGGSKEECIVLNIYDDPSDDVTPYLERIMDLMIKVEVFDIIIHLIDSNSKDGWYDYIRLTASELFIKNKVYKKFVKKVSYHMKSIMYYHKQ